MKLGVSRFLIPESEFTWNISASADFFVEDLAEINIKFTPETWLE